ncbi:hypothetical protein GH714_018072 [Hevea brasiliensis]|uniref:Uncharacterized protein n=1 Tax=Hevea brasiliensis TaxID=3981 RepID=A0A6A6KXR4_HEVBR|nr:hypothetical protein GH714_018072 [Hevea brasiliensis]
MVLAKGKEPKLPTPPLELASVESLPCCSLGSMRLIGPSEVPSSDGERDSGMEDAKDMCVLPRELPPEKEVGCVREPVAGSPREVVLPKQERPRQRCSRGAGRGARPRGRQRHLATRTGKALKHSRRPKAMGRMDMREVLDDEGNLREFRPRRSFMAVDRMGVSIGQFGGKRAEFSGWKASRLNGEDWSAGKCHELMGQEARPNEVPPIVRLVACACEGHNGAHHEKPNGPSVLGTPWKVGHLWIGKWSQVNPCNVKGANTCS